VGDHLHSQNGENDRHEWQKAESELEYLISRLTEPGELVCDPFCGSGTTLAVAKRLNRRWIGTELDATTAKGARRRVA
jgi:DNA modification methylase